MTAKHTPGPWSVNSMTRIEAAGFGLIASIRGGLDDNTTHANARLVAAAPEMLAALELFLTWIPLGEEWHYERSRIQAAIAKAKGSAA
jgi:hypothetical protein